MSYPGNSTLGDEVRERILGTFSQSLDLAETGRRQEAVLGCDFILELDPEFTPAETLKSRLVSSSEAPELSDLRRIARGEPPAAGEGEEEPAGESPAGASAEETDPSAELDRSADELFDLSEMGDAPAPPSSSAAAPPPPASSEESLERDFQGLLERAGEHHEAVAADPELRKIAMVARERLEAQPYVEGFLREAAEARRAGDDSRVRVALDKVRSLDPDHPRLDELSGAGGTGGGARPAPEAEEVVFELGDADVETEISVVDEDEGEQAVEEGDLFGGFDLSELPDPEGPEPAARPPEEPAGGSDESEPSELSVLGGEPGSGEGDDRISQLLADGQAAADAGDYQTAIDAWSRIFLIDVDHQEAARRIEDARRLKAEREREVEEIFHEGLDALDRGEREAARSRFEEVLAKQPNHLAAREYLEQIDSGEPITGPARSPEETAAAGDLTAFDLAEIASGPRTEEEIDEPSPDRVAIPTAPAVEEEPGAGERAAARSGRRSFVTIGGTVLVVVLLAAWFLLQNRDRFFPNSTAEETAIDRPEPVSAITRARALHERGSTAVALGQLKRIRPDHPDYEEAQRLIAEWEGPVAEDAEAVPALSDEDLARRQEILERAERAFEAGSYLTALELYDRARDIAPLDGEQRGRLRRAADQLEPLADEIELFRQGEYALILPRLWRAIEENPADRDARRLLVDSYFNRGVRELRRGDAARAAEEFQEALSLAPDDRDLQRHFLFAQTYQQRSKDLLYRIYVKYLPYR